MLKNKLPGSFRSNILFQAETAEGAAQGPHAGDGEGAADQGDDDFDSAPGAIHRSGAEEEGLDQDGKQGRLCQPERLDGEVAVLAEPVKEKGCQHQGHEAADEPVEQLFREIPAGQSEGVETHTLPSLSCSSIPSSFLIRSRMAAAFSKSSSLAAASISLRRLFTSFGISLAERYSSPSSAARGTV